MWLENLKELKQRSKKTYKDISVGTGIPAKTIERIFNGYTESPTIGSLIPIISFLGGNFSEVFADTQAVVGNATVTELQENIEVANAEKDLVLAVGSKHGFDVDKFEENNIEAKKSKLVNAPVVDGCIGYLECKVIDEPEMQKKYDIVMVEIVAAYADEQAFDGQKYTLNSELTTIHHLADDKLVATGNII